MLVKKVEEIYTRIVYSDYKNKEEKKKKKKIVNDRLKMISFF
jgi:hypothetical protein